MPPILAPTPLSNAPLDRLCQIVERKTGLIISPAKKRDLEKKIAAVINDANGSHRSLETYFQQLESSPISLQTLVNELTIGESYFFRNHPHFAALQNTILPAIIEQKSQEKVLKIWSAGSSTGEEPYSVAIMLERDFPMLSDWDVKIMATDLNTGFIERAKAGTYTKWSFRGVDKVTMDTYFNRNSDGRYSLIERIKNNVTFSKLNLATLPQRRDPFLSNCDLILCRNVLIYFKNLLATQICEAFSDCLDDQGFLLLGHSEAFPTIRNLKTVYAHATYYYQKDLQQTPPSRPPLARMSLVPGLGLYDPDKMFSHENNKYENSTDAMSAANNGRKQFETTQTNAIEQKLNAVRDLSMEGELDQAETLLQQLEVAEGRLDYRVYFLKALVADQLNSPEEALRHLKQAIFLNKEFTIGHYYQGIIAERFGDLSLAKRGYRNAYALAAELRPDSEVHEGGGIHAKILCEIAQERLKELEL